MKHALCSKHNCSVVSYLTQLFICFRWSCTVPSSAFRSSVSGGVALNSPHIGYFLICSMVYSDKGKGIFYDSSSLHTGGGDIVLSSEESIALPIIPRGRTTSFRGQHYHTLLYGEAACCHKIYQCCCLS